MTEEQTKKIKAKIRRYERTLQKEKAERGYIHDGAGKRYVLGPMYLEINDVEGAIKSFDWFEHTFSDDIGEPFQYLCWALALFKAGRKAEAEKRLIQTMLMNLYLIPQLLGRTWSELDIWHGSNLEMPGYLDYLPEEYLELWDKEALAWAGTVYDNPRTQQIRQKYIDIQSQLKHEPPGPKRSVLVKETMGLMQGEF